MDITDRLRHDLAAGAVVDLPPGEYVCGHVPIPGDATIRGASSRTVIRKAPGLDTHMWSLSPGAHRVTIADLRLVDETGSPGSVIHGHDVFNVSLRDLAVEGSSIHLQGAIDTRLTDLDVSGSRRGAGIRIERGFCCWVTRCVVAGSSGDPLRAIGISLDTCTRVQLTNNTARENAGNGIDLARSQFCVLLGNIATGNGLDGIVLDGWAESNSDNILQANQAISNGEHGYWIDSSQAQVLTDRLIVIGNAACANRGAAAVLRQLAGGCIVRDNAGF